MKIKIDKTKITEIEKALADANGKSEAHAYNLYSEIEAIIEDAQGSLKYLPKTHWKGATVTATSGEAVPNAYKYKRNATRIKIERGASAWFLVEVSRATIFQGGGDWRLWLSESQADIIHKGYFEKNKINILPDEK